MGERVNGIHEVRGSTPLGSTTRRRKEIGRPEVLGAVPALADPILERAWNRAGVSRNRPSAGSGCRTGEGEASPAATPPVA